MSWAVGKQKRAAAQTAMMKMDVKPRETVKARTVSNACPPPHARKYSHIHTNPNFCIHFPFIIVILLAKIMSIVQV